MLKSRLFFKVKNILYVDIILFIAGCCGIYQLLERAGFNPAYSLELHATSDRQLVIERIPDAELQGVLMPADTILAINDYPVRSIDELELLTDAQAIGSALSLQVKRQAGRLLKQVVLNAFYTDSYLIIAFTVAMFFLGLGIFVLVKRPDEPSARIYHWVTLAVAMIILTTWGRYTVAPLGIGHTVRILFSAAYAFTPVLFVHFSLIFPSVKWKKYKNLLKPLYFLAALFFLFTSTTFILAVVPAISKRFVSLYLAGFDGTRWFFISSVLLAVLFIFHSLTRAVETDERKKILWLMIGLIIGPLGFIFLWQLPQVLGFNALVPEEFILIFASIMPLTFSISILRYHIMDIEVIINRSAVYLSVVLILLALYASIITLVMSLIDTFTTSNSLITSAVAIMILAVLFEPLKKKIQAVIDRKFFRVRYNYRLSQRQFSEEMKAGIDEKTLAVFIVNKLDELLQPQCIGLYLKPEKATHLQLIAHRNCAIINDHPLESLHQQLQSTNQNIFAKDGSLEQSIPYTPIENATKQAMSVALSLRTQTGHFLGMLILGEKRSATRFTSEDIDLLKTVTLQFGLTLERIRLQTRLLLKQAETQRLAELNRMQSFFISSVSHDLQTPLTSIRLYLDLLEDGQNLPAEKKRGYLQTISGESDRLSKMIHNVLDSARIERGLMTYSFKSVNLCQLLKKVLQSMRYELESRHFEVVLDIPAQDIHIDCDDTALERVLTNLISNSIKYAGKEKYIEIHISSKQKKVQIVVTDHGCGIKDEEKQKIFDMFYRSTAKDIQTVGGAGLGLSIVQHVIRAHHGTVKVKSKAGQGSTFIIALPINQAQPDGLSD